MNEFAGKKRVDVKMGDFRVGTCADSEYLFTLLGSCVGVALWDQRRKIGGLAHIMLPEAPPDRPVDRPGKYANTAISALVQAMERKGASRRNMIAKVAGGAQMFANTQIRVGEKNVKRALEELARFGIKVVAQDVGKSYGRKVYFDTCTGKVIVESLAAGKVEL